MSSLSGPKAHSFSIAQLSNPSDKVAAKARNLLNPYGKLLYEVFPPEDGSTYDRFNVEQPHCQAWAEGKGDFYVSTDIAQLSFEETDLQAGQYYQSVSARKTSQKWTRSSNGKAAPGNCGGFHKAVIDTEQPGTLWTLSARLVTTAIFGQSFEGCAQFAAISRIDYNGFRSSVDPNKDQCRNHLKVSETIRLGTGKILIQDADNLIARAAPKKGTSSSTCPKDIVHTPMDGYYPIILHRDRRGKIDLIMIQLL